MKNNPKTTSFGHIVTNQHIQFFGALSLLLVYAWFTLDEETREFKT